MNRSSARALLQSVLAASAAGALIIGISAPAQAQMLASNSTAASSASAAAAAATGQRTARKDDRNQKVCIAEAITGSRMPKKVCKSRQEWSAEGVDVSAR